MKYQDPLNITAREPQIKILSFGMQVPGSRGIQNEYFMDFNGECFVITDGVDSMPNGNVAAQLAAQTAIWGYKHIRQRPFYWSDKERLLRRIFRSTNLTIWQKRREYGFEKGLATTLGIVIVGLNKVWVGTVGNSPIYLIRDGLIDELTPLDVNENGDLTMALGFQRLGLRAHVITEQFLDDDVVMMCTGGLSGLLDEETIRVACEMIGTSQESLTQATVHLVKTAQEYDSEKQASICLIKKIRIPDSN